MRVCVKSVDKDILSAIRGGIMIKKKSDKAPRVWTNKFGAEEYEARMKNAYYAEMEDGDKEVFEAIDEEVAELERAQGKHYVYLTADLYRKLEYAFKRRMSIQAAMSYCNIRRTKMDKLFRKYTKLREQVEMWKGFVEAAASENIAAAIVDGKDLDTSKWYKERIDRTDFGKTVDVNVNGNVTHDHQMNVKKALEIREMLLGGANEDKAAKAIEVKAEVVESKVLESNG